MAKGVLFSRAVVLRSYLHQITAIAALFHKVIFSTESEEDALVSQLPNWVKIGHMNTIVALLSILATQCAALIHNCITKITTSNNHRLHDKRRVLTERFS